MDTRIQGYTPDPRDVGAATWAVIRPEVISTVTDAAPATPYQAGELLLAVSRIAAFAHGRGLPAERMHWLDPVFIELFTTVGLPDLKDSSRANIRSRLLRVAEAVAGVGAVGQARTVLAGSDPREPYSPGDLSRLWAWASALPEGGPRDNVCALLAACLGAGLASEDLIPCRGSHVRVTGSGTVVVNVPGRRPRLTVCRHEWEEHLARAGDRAGDSFLFRPGRSTCGRNTVSNYLDRLKRPTNCPPLSAQRCRATWLVQHLTEGTPIQVLIPAAGVNTFHALSRYLPFVPDADISAAEQQLRGTR